MKKLTKRMTFIHMFQLVLMVCLIGVLVLRPVGDTLALITATSVTVVNTFTGETEPEPVTPVVPVTPVEPVEPDEPEPEPEPDEPTEIDDSTESGNASESSDFIKESIRQTHFGLLMVAAVVCLAVVVSLLITRFTLSHPDDDDEQ